MFHFWNIADTRKGLSMSPFTTYPVPKSWWRGKCAWYQPSAVSMFTPLNPGLNEKGSSSHQETMIGDCLMRDFAVDLCFWISLERRSNSELVELVHSCCQATEMLPPHTHEASDLRGWSINQPGGVWLANRRRTVRAHDAVTTLCSFKDRGQLHELINSKHETDLELVQMASINNLIFPCFLFLILIPPPHPHPRGAYLQLCRYIYHLFQQVFESAAGEQ